MQMDVKHYDKKVIYVTATCVCTCMYIQIYNNKIKYENKLVLWEWKTSFEHPDDTTMFTRRIRRNIENVGRAQSKKEKRENKKISLNV